MKKIIILLFLITLMIPVSMAKSNSESFLKAVEDKNYNTVAKLLKSGVNPNVITPDGELTALMIAIDNKDLNTLQLLLDNGADPNFRSKTDMSPVLRIVVRNNPDDAPMLKLLLEHNADFMSHNNFQYVLNPVSLSIKLKNYTAFNMFNEYKKFNKCDIAFFKMQGQMIKNNEHWNAIDTWKSCKMMPVNDSLIGLTLEDVLSQFGKPVSSSYIGRNSFEITYINLYSKYVDNPVNEKHWIIRGDSPTNTKKRLVNRCKDYKSFYIDKNIVVDIKNSEFKVDNPIKYYMPKI